MIPDPKFHSTDPEMSSDYFHIGEDNIAVGIADGVGQWKQFGINPREFVEQLITLIVECIEFTLDNVK